MACILVLTIFWGVAPGVLPTPVTGGLAAPLAYITVSSPADTQVNDGFCTLREAILNANADDQSGSTDCAAGSGTDTIAFDADTCGFSGTSLKNTDPLLLGLDNYGGTTSTMALAKSSPAIDRIPSGVNGCGTTLPTDQRGFLRPLDGNLDGTAACDVGAYEYNYWLNFLPSVIRSH
jgi:CSLREA domain-containing protein